MVHHFGNNIEQVCVSVASGTGTSALTPHVAIPGRADMAWKVGDEPAESVSLVEGHLDRRGQVERECVSVSCYGSDMSKCRRLEQKQGAN